jgi:hypothetical protein
MMAQKNAPKEGSGRMPDLNPQRPAITWLEVDRLVKAAESIAASLRTLASGVQRGDKTLPNTSLPDILRGIAKTLESMAIGGKVTMVAPASEPPPEAP